MIVQTDVKQNEIVKVLVITEDQDIEEEMYARVVDNRIDHLEINYLEETNKFYKDALVYSFSDNIDVIRFDSLIEHFYDTYKVEDIDMMKVKDNMYVFLDEVNIEDDSSSIYTDDDEEDEYSIGSFVVDDDDVDGMVEVPHDHKKLDREWNEWEPRSPGARSFKETVERIEYYAKKHADENNF